MPVFCAAAAARAVSAISPSWLATAQVAAQFAAEEAFVAEAVRLSSSGESGTVGGCVSELPRRALQA